MSGRPVPAERPWDLPRLVMRRASTVAVGVLLLALALGLMMVNEDIEEEVDAGMHLADAMAALMQVQSLPAEQALGTLGRLRDQGPLRHLSLEILDGGGRVLLAHADRPLPGWQGMLMRWHQRWLSPIETRQREWELPRPDGTAWRVRLSASHEGERREALSNLLGMLALLLLCVVGLLLTMRWNLHRAFLPLGRLVQAMQGIGRGEAHALLALEPMPVRELEVVATATRQLADSLRAAQAQRRALSRKMLTLQETERSRLAQELHDELGQRLTAMRVLVAGLLRQQAQGSVSRAGLMELQVECERVQHEVRLLLAGLQPFGRTSEPDGEESVARLISLLQALMLRWNEAAPGPECILTLDLACVDVDGRPCAWPQGSEAENLTLPQSLAQVIYRITQESLTNAARHARAQRVRVELIMRLGGEGVVARIDWRVSDDGIGIADMAQALRRGHGLAGINQRIWSTGSDLQAGPACDDPARPGLRLAARFELGLPADAADT